MQSFTLVLTAVAIGIGALGAGLLWWRSRTGGLLGASALAVAAQVVAGVAALCLLVPVGLELFGALHLAYLGVVVSVPVVGVALVARAAVATPRRPRWAGIGALVAVLPATVGFYATHVEPNRLVVDRVDLPVAADRAGDDPLTIAVLSDLQTDHVGSFQRRAVDRLMAAEPDVILVPGDLFHAPDATFDEWLTQLRDLLAGLRAPGGVFVVQGDVDGSNRVHEAFAGNPDARVLDDEVVTVEVGDRTLRVGGTMLDYASPAAGAVRRQLEAGPDDGSIRILLSHRPDTVFGLSPSSPVDVTVAGHTHGGQVVLPGFGPLLTLTGVPRAVAAGGLHAVDGNRIYVSPGVGLERRQAPQIRFNDPPTIGVLELADAA